MTKPSLETIVSLASRRGFVFQSSSVYGGLSASYDYGHYGNQLKRNLRDAWWNSMLREQDDVISLDSAIIQHPKVWDTSGHLALFNDPVQSCNGCGARLRADHVAEGKEPCRAKPSVCAGQAPQCDLGPVTDVNLMFSTHTGAKGDKGSEVFLRPETAQGIFINFENVTKSSRVKVPFGIAQIGKSFRNEITARQFVFRTREFEQAEMEWFCHPDDADKWYQHWRKTRMDWYESIGINPENLRLRDHEQTELSHYSAATADVDYLFPWGWDEMEGIANRGDYDLSQHLAQAKFGITDKQTKSKFAYRDPVTNELYTPHVIEPAMGVDRLFFAALCDAYTEDEVEGDKRVVLKFSPKIAPVKAAVLPLLRKDGQPEVAKEIFKALKLKFDVEYDDTGSLGKRYRRQDEIGTPFCITVDHQSVEDKTVTVRDRDTLEQKRVHMDDLELLIQRAL